MKDSIISFSCGGGIQSVAIGVLIRQGALPMPDLAVIADTGREKQSTWDYLHNVLQPYLDPCGLKVQIASHELARVDLYDKDGLTLMPAYTKEGRLGAFCSGEWKRDVIERWLRKQGVKDCVQWLGFSSDEQRRATYKAHRPWCRPAYPLIDMVRLSRAGCERIIQAAGLPLPKKSRCWQCPHQNAEEWAEIKASPEEWEKAVCLDKEIRANDPTGKEELFLHSSRVPLDMADLTVPEADEPLFRGCLDAGCFT